MDLWTFLWIFISAAILISILESVHRKAKRRRAERLLQLQISAGNQQPYHVYTIHGNNNGTDQQQIYSSNNAHIIRLDDLPPKYEDLVIANNAAFVSSTPNLVPLGQPPQYTPTPVPGQSTAAMEPTSVTVTTTTSTVAR